MRSARQSLILSLTLVVAACGRDVVAPERTQTLVGPSNPAYQSNTTATDDPATAPIFPAGDAINRALAARGISARLTAVHLMVNKDYPPGAPTFYTVDRTHHLYTQFVANDPRREPFVGLGWTYDMRHGTATTIVNGSPALWTAAQSHDLAKVDVQTWTGLPCYKAVFEEEPYPVAPGYENVEWIDDYFLGSEAQPFHPVAEITFGGVMPYAFFQIAYGPYASYILGVTYSFSFYDSSGNPTDIDHNGKLDTFWTEIYFNGLYAWGDTQDYFSPNIDLGTVGLHESGHAFGLGHDGMDFDNHGGFHIASYNIMTQIYLPQRSVSGVPTASFCSIYGSWH